MSRAIAAIFAILILSVVGVYGLQAALANAGEDTIVRNEVFTPTADTIITLDNSKIDQAYYDVNVEVINGSGVIVTEGVDYEWYESNGTIEPLSGGDLAGDVNPEITYGFQVPDKEQRELTALLSNMPSALGLLFPAFVVAIALMFLRGM